MGFIISFLTGFFLAAFSVSPVDLPFSFFQIVPKSRRAEKKKLLKYVNYYESLRIPRNLVFASFQNARKNHSVH